MSDNGTTAYWHFAPSPDIADWVSGAPYSWHEGNYALLQALSGERAEDRALEEDLKKGSVRPVDRFKMVWVSQAPQPPSPFRS